MKGRGLIGRHVRVKGHPTLTRVREITSRGVRLEHKINGKIWHSMDDVKFQRGNFTEKA